MGIFDAFKKNKVNNSNNTINNKPKTVTQTINEADIGMAANNELYFLRNFSSPSKPMYIPNSIFLLSNLGCVADNRNQSDWEKFIDFYFKRYADAGYKESPLDFANCCFQMGICRQSQENLNLIVEAFNASNQRVPELVRYMEKM